MNEITTQQLIEIVSAISAAITSARDELNSLDSALGDGDHGTALSVAFADAVEKITVLEQPTSADILRVVASSLMNRMGGASGALYGTLFLRACGTVQGKYVLTHDDLKTMWQVGLEGVMQRGKAQPGDKTMIDALQPAVNAFAEADDLHEAFRKAAAAAARGARSTAQMIAKHGRAKFAGERSLGHEDAGAGSITVMFSAMRDYWKENHDGQA
ncbi:MAG: dihydroxyacetone kinase subunit L [Burkholderiales bacterium]|nr:dihydroxyacetone kinase subunit L [Anaerolineae bacterium]